jgi:uncharacterized protein (DUF2384 family)
MYGQNQSMMRQYELEATMAAIAINTIPGYRFENAPDISRPEVRERLSRSALAGFFAIMDKWQIPADQAGELLGGVPRSTVYKMKEASTTLRQDELTRISYIVGIYKALHILLPDEPADRWIAQPNDNFLFGGRPPLEFMVQAGIPGFQQVRSMLDAARGGH